MSRLVTCLLICTTALLLALSFASCTSTPVLPADTVDPGNNNPPADPPADQPGDPPATDGTEPPADTSDTDPGIDDEEPVVYPFSIEVDERSFRLGGSIDRLELSYKEIAGDDLAQLPWNGSGQALNYDLVELDVTVIGAEQLKEFVCEVTFDGYAMFPEASWIPMALQEGGESWLYGPIHFGFVEDDPHKLLYAMSIINQDEAVGFTGDGLLLQLYFSLPGWSDGSEYPPATIFGEPYAVPQLEDCRQVLEYSESSGMLSWVYNLPGDFDQSGAADIYDTLQLSLLFGDTATGMDSLAGMLTGLPDGTVDIASFSNIGRHFKNRVDSFALFAGALAVYPAGGEQVGSVAFADAIGDPTVERLRFEFALTPSAGVYYWVKPVYDGEFGVPSEAYTF